MHTHDGKAPETPNHPRGVQKKGWKMAMVEVLKCYMGPEAEDPVARTAKADLI